MKLGGAISIVGWFFNAAAFIILAAVFQSWGPLIGLLGMLIGTGYTASYTKNSQFALLLLAGRLHEVWVDRERWALLCDERRCPVCDNKDDRP